MVENTSHKSMFYGATAETIKTAANLRKNMTLPELILWEKLRDRNLFTTKFRRQHPVNMFIADFYCHEFKLVIEIDGKIHLSSDKEDYDSKRTSELEKYGITVIRFTNDQVLYDLRNVLKNIREKLSELLAQTSMKDGKH